MQNFFTEIGLKPEAHYLVHSSFKQIKNNTSYNDALSFLMDMMNIITPYGSIIMPTFTYNFVKKDQSHNIYEKFTSQCWTGYLANEFMQLPYVYRTSSPSHSFAVWGEVLNHIDNYDNPKSPLGKDSIMHWLTNQQNTYILMLGVDFTSLSYGHYLEVVAPTPWANIFCWSYMDILPQSESIEGIFDLIEVPGCSQSFISFENFLLENNFIKPIYFNNLKIYNIKVELLYKTGIEFFRTQYKNLLCKYTSCKACDERRKILNIFD